MPTTENVGESISLSVIGTEKPDLSCERHNVLGSKKSEMKAELLYNGTQRRWLGDSYDRVAQFGGKNYLEHNHGSAEKDLITYLLNAGHPYALECYNHLLHCSQSEVCSLVRRLLIESDAHYSTMAAISMVTQLRRALTFSFYC